MADGMWTYKGWSISVDPKPIPNRSFDWEATHPDYDAWNDGDGWQDNGLSVNAATYEELLEAIDQWEAIAEEDAAEEAANNGQFGVGA